MTPAGLRGRRHETDVQGRRGGPRGRPCPHAAGRSASMGRRSRRSPSRSAISSDRGRASTSSSRRSTRSRATGGWRPTGTCPIGSHAAVRLTNSSKAPVTVSAVVSVDRAQPPEGSLTFHARWRYQDDLQTKKADGTLDWPALRVSGSSGRFVGLLLEHLQPHAGLVGRGRREDLRRWRELPQHVRHRDRGLLRLRLGRQPPLHESVPRPDAVRRPRHARGTAATFATRSSTPCRSTNRSVSTSRSGTGRP